MLTVEVQVYWPPSDTLTEDNAYSTDIAFGADMTVEFGSFISMSGRTSRPGTTVAEHRREYVWPTMERPVNEMATSRAGRDCTVMVFSSLCCGPCTVMYGP
jgi:hypothetical protein